VYAVQRIAEQNERFQGLRKEPQEIQVLPKEAQPKGQQVERPLEVEAYRPEVHLLGQLAKPLLEVQEVFLQEVQEVTVEPQPQEVGESNKNSF